MDHRRHAPATIRNRDPILEVLRGLLPPMGSVLEIASGSGEHIIYFAPRLPLLDWQPSDVDPASLESVKAWAATVKTCNLKEPILLDAGLTDWPVSEVDAILCTNLLHISPWSTTLGLLRGASEKLSAGGLLAYAGLIAIRDNRRALTAIFGVMIAGCGIVVIATALFVLPRLISDEPGAAWLTLASSALFSLGVERVWTSRLSASGDSSRCVFAPRASAHSTASVADPNDFA